MRRRWGLRAKMSASYLLVTAAAVLVVEIVALVLVQPLLDPPPTDASLPVQATAQNYVNRVVDANARLSRLPTDAEIQLGDPTLRLAPGEARVDESGKAMRIPFTATNLRDDSKPMSLALLLDNELRIVASSYPDRYPVGGRIGGPEVGVLPVDVIIKFSRDIRPNSGQFQLSNGPVL